MNAGQQGQTGFKNEKCAKHGMAMWLLAATEKVTLQ